MLAIGLKRLIPQQLKFMPQNSTDLINMSCHWILTNQVLDPAKNKTDSESPHKFMIQGI